MPNQNKGTFPSDTQKNPKDCMAIHLRSGKDLISNKETKAKKEKTEEKAEKNSQLEQLKGSNDQKRRKEYQLMLLQYHSHKDFRSQGEKNNSLNSWIFSRK